MLGTVPGVPTRAADRTVAEPDLAVAVVVDPDPGASSGTASTLRRWLTVARLVVDPAGRNSAVSVPLPSAQAYTKNSIVLATTPVTFCVCDAVPQAPIPRPALSLDTMTW